jgi:hypothetical protein
MLTLGNIYQPEHIFSKKNLSKHSTGAYVELCQEVGSSFEAVAKV